jgi:hypothetical protein
MKTVPCSLRLKSIFTAWKIYNSVSSVAEETASLTLLTKKLAIGHDPESVAFTSHHWIRSLATFIHRSRVEPPHVILSQFLFTSHHWTRSSVSFHSPPIIGHDLRSVVIHLQALDSLQPLPVISHLQNQFLEPTFICSSHLFLGLPTSRSPRAFPDTDLTSRHHAQASNVTHPQHRLQNVNCLPPHPLDLLWHSRTGQCSSP